MIGYAGNTCYMRVKKYDFILMNSTNLDRSQLKALGLMQIACWPRHATSSAHLLYWHSEEVRKTVQYFILRFFAK